MSEQSVGGLGSRIRILRTSHKLGLRQLARRAEISAGFLSKIEAGGKLPTFPTLGKLARALDTTASALVAAEEGTDVGERGRAVDAVDRIPFRELELSAGRLALDAARISPRRGDVGAEHLLRAAVRWRLETQVLDDEIERRSADFRSSMPPDRLAWDIYLREWLSTNCGVHIGTLDLEQRPALRGDRAVLVGQPPRLLLLNPLLSSAQTLFVLAREAGYVACGLDARSRVYPPNQEYSFEQVFNDYKASYFAAALLVPTSDLLTQLTTVIESFAWSPKAFEMVLDSYRDVATDETVMYRFSQVMGRRDPPVRTHFLKIVSPAEGVHRIEKRLNLSSEILLGGLGEHLCRRWLATSVIQDLRKQPTITRVVDAQVSRFPNSDEAYVGVSVARAADAVCAARYGDGIAVSVTVGFRISPHVKDAIQVLKDPNLRQRTVGSVCERCALQCDIRAAEPTLLERELELKALLELG